MVTSEAAEAGMNLFVMDHQKLCKLGFRVLTYILEVNRDSRTPFKYLKQQSDIIRVIIKRKISL